MQPVVRGHTADADMPATQNFLPNKRNHDGMINVVVDSVAGRYSFEGKLRGFATDVSPFIPIDDGRLLNQLAVWAPEPALRKKILVDNPARLYGF